MLKLGTNFTPKKHSLRFFNVNKKEIFDNPKISFNTNLLTVYYKNQTLLTCFTKAMPAQIADSFSGISL